MKRGLVTHPKDWPWSKFSSYSNLKQGPIRVDPVHRRRELNQEPTTALPSKPARGRAPSSSTPKAAPPVHCTIRTSSPGQPSEPLSWLVVTVPFSFPLRDEPK
jgi:hypothetical protein